MGFRIRKLRLVTWATNQVHMIESQQKLWSPRPGWASPVANTLCVFVTHHCWEGHDLTEDNWKLWVWDLFKLCPLNLFFRLILICILSLFKKKTKHGNHEYNSFQRVYEFLWWITNPSLVSGSLNLQLVSEVKVVCGWCSLKLTILDKFEDIWVIPAWWNQLRTFLLIRPIKFYVSETILISTKF